MDQAIEKRFIFVVKHIFDNWTALQLAIEHEMGGPSSRETANDIIKWMCDYCLDRPEVEVSDVTEVLEDILDEEFSTVCEDDSPKEVAQLLAKFRNLLSKGQFELFDSEVNNLPNCTVTPSQKIQPTTIRNEVETEPNEMDVDPEWTVVHNRRKK